MIPLVPVGSYTSTNIDGGRVATGVAIIILGIATIMVGPMISELLPGLPAVMMYLAGGVVVVVGIAVAFSSLSRDMDSIYLEDGVCMIVNVHASCSGGCKTCVFAHEYLRRVALDRSRGKSD